MLLPYLDGVQMRSASTMCRRREYGLRGVGFTLLISTNTSPDMSQDFKASCCSPSKLFIPMASQCSCLDAQSRNSASVLRCHSLAASGVRPRISRLTAGFRLKPTPTTLVRLVLMADVAAGDAM